MRGEDSVAVDFDGVLHSFTSGWQGPKVIADPPTEGAIPWLKQMIETFDVQIYSARNCYWGGKRAIKKWLWTYSMTDDEISRLSFPTKKPIARMIIDDRAVCFTGKFPTTEEICLFEPWHKQPIFGEKK